MTEHPYRLQCEQWKLTTLGCRMLRDLPAAELRFSRRVLSYQQDGDGVTVQVEAPQAIETIRGRYLIACDGANSIIRKWMGVAFDGFTYEEKFLCLSTVAPVEQTLGDICNVNYMADPEEWLVLLRAPTAWRVLVPATEAEPDAELLSDRRKDAVFARLLRTGESIETTHRTIYRMHQRVARRYREGRVVLVGDAAHLNNPLGGFGMNAALHDVRNLCGQLLAILQDDGDDALLDRYERQRRTVMQEFIQAQSIRNKQAMEMSADGKFAAAEQELQAIAADPVRRREYLLRQSMYTSVAREKEIA
jgi:3-(3-hydroxy-phenyl)propionate hydroxylase